MKVRIFTTLLIVISFFKLYCEDYYLDNKVMIEISKPYDVTDCLLYNITRKEDNYYLTFLSMNKQIKFGSIDLSNDDYSSGNFKEIYSYEKADTILYLDTFYYNNRFYIAHLEKYSYELFLSSFSDIRDIDTVKIGDTDLLPQIFLDEHLLKCFLYDRNKKSFLFREINLYNNKQREIYGEKDLSSFGVSHFIGNNNYSILWQKNDNSKYFYVSIMDKEMKAYSPVTLLRFNQKVIVPKMILSDTHINLAFSLDYRNYYLRYPYSSDIRDYEKILFPEEFQNFSISDFFYLNGLYVVLFKKIVTNYNKEKYNIVEAAFFDKDFKYSVSKRLDKVEGLTSNFSLISYKDHIFLFRIENIKNRNILRYSEISLVRL